MSENFDKSENVWIDLGFTAEEAEGLERHSQRFMMLQEHLKKHLFEKSHLMTKGFTAEEMLNILAGKISTISETRTEELLKLFDQ